MQRIGVEMKKPVYVFGHRNPDTDSICSAIAYANLKQALGEKYVQPARLGSINKETKYVLEYFNVPEPDLLKEIKVQVKDLALKPIEVVRQQDSIMRVVDVTVNKNEHLTPVVDQHERLIGVITIPDLYPNLIGIVGKNHLAETHTPFQNIIDVLDAKILYGQYPNEYIFGDIYTFSEIHKEGLLKKGDIVVLGYNEDYLEQVVQCGASCIIIASEDRSISTIKVLEGFKGIIMATRSSVFNVMKLIARTVPVESMVNKKMLEYFEMDDYIDEVKDQILASKHRNFPVVDENGVVKGLLSRSDLLRINRKQVILVDHNEYGQSVKGIEEAEIIEVIDHHRIANIQTMAPLYYRAEPVGCTSTIIAHLYEEHGIQISRPMAGIMLSAILSDTLLFHSPTCTVKDKQMARQLAKIAEVPMDEYGMNMIIAGTAVDDESPEDLITRDMKKFTFGKYKVMVSQINTGDFKGLSKMLALLKEKLEEICKQEQNDLGVLMVTNIVFGGSEIIVAGKEKWIAQKAFNIRSNEDTIYLSGVFSRKKQIVPVLMNAAEL
jgi:manganese-dependent inorganic pyrophosphatase